MTQRDIRQSVDIGPKFGQVSSVAYWHKHNHYANDEESQGAFKLAYQQAMDGMGKSISEWMGLTNDEFNLWMSDGTLPKKKSNH